MNKEKLIKSIKLNEYMKYIMNMYYIYNHMTYLQQITYICSTDDLHKENNINYIINDINKYGYKIDNCTEYKDLIICLEKIKLSINDQVKNYIKNNVKIALEERMIRKIFDIE